MKLYKKTIFILISVVLTLLLIGCESGTTNQNDMNVDSLTSVVIEGQNIVGEELTVTILPLGATAEFQWEIADPISGSYSEIENAKNDRYTILSSDEGKYLRVRVNGIQNFTGTLISDSTEEILPQITSEDYFDFDINTSTILQFYPEGKNGDLPIILSPHIPASINNTAVEIIGDKAFLDKETGNSLGITKLIIPEGVKEIGEEILFYNQELKNLILPDSLEKIGFYAFGGNKLETVNIPENVNYIGAYAFSDNKIKSINLPNTLSEIKDGTLLNNHLETIEIPESITTIGVYSFAENNLKEIIIPDQVNFIGGRAFFDNNLEKVILGEKVEEIGTSSYIASFAANNLSYIKIPANVKSIAERTFQENQLNRILIESPGIELGRNLLHGATGANTNEFRTAYLNGGAGLYTGTQTGSWEKIELEVFPNNASFDVTYDPNYKLLEINTLIDTMGNDMITEFTADDAKDFDIHLIKNSAPYNKLNISKNKNEIIVVDPAEADGELSGAYTLVISNQDSLWTINVTAID